MGEGLPKSWEAKKVFCKIVGRSWGGELGPSIENIRGKALKAKGLAYGKDGKIFGEKVGSVLGLWDYKILLGGELLKILGI